MSQKMRDAAIKAGKTGRWAKIMAKWLISYSSRGGRKWHLISFDGPTGAEASGIVDFIAIRKDFSTPEETLKRGDLFSIVLIQSKGGSASWPNARDVERLARVAEHYRAKDVVLAEWKKGSAPLLHRLVGTEWVQTNATNIFGALTDPRVHESLVSSIMAGHGVEFRHDDVHGTPVAYLEGYRWREDLKSRVQVQSLKSPPKGLSIPQWARIQEELRRALCVFLDKRKRGALPIPNGDKVGKVMIWYNA